jgi:hypothetical protein
MNIIPISISFLKLGESMPVMQEVSYIDADKYYILVTVSNAETIEIGGIHSNYN